MTRKNAKNLKVIPWLDGDGRGDTNIYQSIGVEPIVNCRGTFTIIGGSVERPEVLGAMKAAAGYFVQYDELAAAVGERLAAVTGAEWGLIASGCAAGIRHVTTACVTGGNPERLIRVPDLTGFDKTEVIIPRSSRNAYDHAVRNVGVDIVMVDSAEELEQAINPKTAMIYFVTNEASETGQPLSLEVMAAIAQPRGIPILADAAAENLTIPPVHLDRGATVVAYSGGKALCGPQCAGIVLGRKDLLQSAWQASSPHHGPGRDDKIGKEEVLGMLAAVEAWVLRDHEQEWQDWLAILDQIGSHVADIASVTTNVTESLGLTNRAPRLNICWDPGILNITGAEVAEDFARKAPRIAVGSHDSATQACIDITPTQMQPGDADVVSQRVHAILSKSRPARTGDMKAPAADLSGRWNLTVRYFTSTSDHQLDITQNGNWIQGVHQSEFSTQNLTGSIEGDQIKLSSAARKPGDNVPFLFGGKLKGDTITGDIHLGEYLTATFKATRAQHPANHPITIPGGPPLAT